MRYEVKVRYATLLIAGALILGSAVHDVLGQQAERIDRFQAKAFDEDAVKAKVFEIARKLREGDQRSKGLIITYTIPTFTGRCLNDSIVSDNRVEIAVRDSLSELPMDISNRITLRNDDMSRHYQAEFWIVPDNANEPEIQESGFKPFCPVCPKFAIRKLSDTSNPRGIEFQTDIDRVCGEDRMSWTVSSGKIISGQGSQKILVDISNSSESTLTVTFNLIPNRPECSACPYEVSLTTEIK